MDGKPLHILLSYLSVLRGTASALLFVCRRAAFNPGGRLIVVAIQAGEHINDADRGA